jgi:hypothetical protein
MLLLDECLLLIRYRLSPETFGYTVVLTFSAFHPQGLPARSCVCSQICTASAVNQLTSLVNDALNQNVSYTTGSQISHIGILSHLNITLIR